MEAGKDSILIGLWAELLNDVGIHDAYGSNTT